MQSKRRCEALDEIQAPLALLRQSYWRHEIFKNGDAIEMLTTKNWALKIYNWPGPYSSKTIRKPIMILEVERTNTETLA